MDDTISRAKAIEICDHAIDLLKGQFGAGALVAIKESIEQLPSAQTEIIRCKDCKYGILDCDFPHERYCDFKGNEWNNDNHYCGHAKRREVTT